MKKKIIYIISILAIITILIPPIIKKETELTLWTNNSENKKEIINYIKDITKEKNKNYIPEEDRIAVFDLDGTLYCETDPVYLSWKMYANKIQNESLDISEKILKKELSLNDETKYLAYKDMTIVEYEEYINDFISGDEEGYTNMTRKQAFYKPMLELINFLQRNQFKIYINSGTDFYLVKNLINDVIDIPESQIIGTQLVVVDDKLTGQSSVKNSGSIKIENMNGIVPVLAFGNSSSDYELLNYVNSNSKYKSMSFMIINDDNVRENGNLIRASQMMEFSNSNNWNIISMKNEWKTIYGFDVNKNV